MALILVTIHGDTDPENTLYPHASSHYCRALTAVGAVPVLAPDGAAEALSEQMDALLLTGGGDVGPALWSRPAPEDLLSFVDPGRDRYEAALFRAFLAAGKPIFGVCRGMQLINVLLGGDLWADLPAERGTRSHGDGQFHDALFAPDTWLFDLFGSRGNVNSYHHQACRTLGEGLRECAVSADGICEAFCHGSLPIWGVQWHPERMIPDMPGGNGDMRALFAFWDRAAEVHRKKNP